MGCPVAPATDGDASGDKRLAGPTKWEQRMDGRGEKQIFPSPHHERSRMGVTFGVSHVRDSKVLCFLAVS